MSSVTQKDFVQPVLLKSCWAPMVDRLVHSPLTVEGSGKLQPLVGWFAGDLAPLARDNMINVALILNTLEKCFANVYKSISYLLSG